MVNFTYQYYPIYDQTKNSIYVYSLDITGKFSLFVYNSQGNFITNVSTSGTFPNQLITLSLINATSVYAVDQLNVYLFSWAGYNTSGNSISSTTVISNVNQNGLVAAYIDASNEYLYYTLNDVTQQENFYNIKTKTGYFGYNTWNGNIQQMLGKYGYSYGWYQSSYSDTYTPFIAQKSLPTSYENQPTMQCLTVEKFNGMPTFFMAEPGSSIYTYSTNIVFYNIILDTFEIFYQHSERIKSIGSILITNNDYPMNYTEIVFVDMSNNVYITDGNLPATKLLSLGNSISDNVTLYQVSGMPNMLMISDSTLTNFIFIPINTNLTPINTNILYGVFNSGCNTNQPTLTNNDCPNSEWTFEQSLNCMANNPYCVPISDCSGYQSICSIPITSNIGSNFTIANTMNVNISSTNSYEKCASNSITNTLTFFDVSSSIGSLSLSLDSIVNGQMQISPGDALCTDPSKCNITQKTQTCYISSGNASIPTGSPFNFPHPYYVNGVNYMGMVNVSSSQTTMPVNMGLIDGYEYGISIDGNFYDDTKIFYTMSNITVGILQPGNNQSSPQAFRQINYALWQKNCNFIKHTNISYFSNIVYASSVNGVFRGWIQLNCTNSYGNNIMGNNDINYYLEVLMMPDSINSTTMLSLNIVTVVETSIPGQTGYSETQDYLYQINLVPQVVNRNLIAFENLETNNLDHIEYGISFDPSSNTWKFGYYYCTIDETYGTVYQNLQVLTPSTTNPNYYSNLSLKINYINSTSNQLGLFLYSTIATDLFTPISLLATNLDIYSNAINVEYSFVLGPVIVSESGNQYGTGGTVANIRYFYLFTENGNNSPHLLSFYNNMIGDYDGGSDACTSEKCYNNVTMNGQILYSASDIMSHGGMLGDCHPQSWCEENDNPSNLYMFMSIMNNGTINIAFDNVCYLANPDDNCGPYDSENDTPVTIFTNKPFTQISTDGTHLIASNNGNVVYTS